MTGQPLTFFQPRAAVRDLTSELKARGGPAYPARAWRLALEVVESRDTMRRVKALNDSLWPDPGRVVVARYLGDQDPHRLVFCGFAVRIAQGAPDPLGRELEPEAQRHKERERRRAYRERHPEQLKAINARYRKRDRARVAAWQRAYYQRRLAASLA